MSTWIFFGGDLSVTDAAAPLIKASGKEAGVPRYDVYQQAADHYEAQARAARPEGRAPLA